MIYLSDLSPLMQRAIAKGITFMVSQSGIPHNYNLYFAKYTDKGNCSVLLSYHEQQGKIYQCADENHPVIPFSDIKVDPKNPRVEVVIEDYEGGKPCYERKGKN